VLICVLSDTANGLNCGVRRNRSFSDVFEQQFRCGAQPFPANSNGPYVPSRRQRALTVRSKGGVDLCRTTTPRPDFGFPHGDARLDFTDLMPFPVGFFGTLGIWPGGVMIGSLVVAFVGAVLLVWITRLPKRA